MVHATFSLLERQLLRMRGQKVDLTPPKQRWMQSLNIFKEKCKGAQI
jgi:hypothetical protein